MGEEKKSNEVKQNPIKDIKPKEIPTVRRTYEYHGNDNNTKKSQGTN